MSWPNVPEIKDFSPHEFDSPDDPGSGIRMNLPFLHMLQALRVACGIALVIDSGVRTIAHNKAVHGEDNSAHITGEAADIRALSSGTRYLILSNAIKLGFNRIGIGASFIHLDFSTTLDQRVIWVYPSGTTKKLTPVTT